MSTDFSLYQRLTLGLVRSLEQRDGVCNVNLAPRKPVDRSDVLSWEQKYSCVMPDDLRNYYLTSDGMLLTWDVKINDVLFRIGCMEIHPLEKLLRIGVVANADTATDRPSLTDVDLIDHDSLNKGDEISTPTFDQRSRIFQLDSCNGDGKVCFVYRNAKPGLPTQSGDVWFLDRSLSWHFLADSFAEYYRMMLIHQGLPQWWYGLTSLGLPPAAQQWFHLYCPSLMSDDDDDLPDIQDDLKGASGLDVARVFKGKSDRKKAAAAQNIKRKPVSSAKGPPGRGAAAVSQPSKPPMR